MSGGKNQTCRACRLYGKGSMCALLRQTDLPVTACCKDCKKKKCGARCLNDPKVCGQAIRMTRPENAIRWREAET